jgi:hypothetical protein
LIDLPALYIKPFGKRSAKHYDFIYLIGKTTMNNVIDNTTGALIPNANAPTVNGIDDLLHDIGTLAVDVGNAESFAISGKERLTKLLSDLRETGAVLAGDTRTNKTRAVLRDAIAETGVSAQRVKDILSFLTMYFDSACAVTTLQSNAAVKASIEKQVEIRQGAGENVVPSTTKTAKPKKSDAEKAKKLNTEFETKLLADSIEVTIEKLFEHKEFHYLINFIESERLDTLECVDKFATFMSTVRLERDAKRAELQKQIAELQAQL